MLYTPYSKCDLPGSRRAVVASTSSPRPVFGREPLVRESDDLLGLHVDLVDVARPASAGSTGWPSACCEAERSRPTPRRSETTGSVTEPSPPATSSSSLPSGWSSMRSAPGSIVTGDEKSVKNRLCDLVAGALGADVNDVVVVLHRLVGADVRHRRVDGSRYFSSFGFLSCPKAESAKAKAQTVRGARYRMAALRSGRGVGWFEEPTPNPSPEGRGVRMRALTPLPSGRGWGWVSSRYVMISRIGLPPWAIPNGRPVLSGTIDSWSMPRHW